MFYETFNAWDENGCYRYISSYLTTALFMTWNKTVTSALRITGQGLGENRT